MAASDVSMGVMPFNAGASACIGRERDTERASDDLGSVGGQASIEALRDERRWALSEKLACPLPPPTLARTDGSGKPDGRGMPSIRSCSRGELIPPASSISGRGSVRRRLAKKVLGHGSTPASAPSTVLRARELSTLLGVPARSRPIGGKGKPLMRSCLKDDWALCSRGG
eukprot:scaffold7709_cov62-Phaeocystis_antarctica.AAC.12